MDRVRLRRLFDTCPRLAQQVNHASIINDVQFSPDGQRFLTCGQDGYVRLWPATNSSGSVFQLQHSPDAEVLQALFSPDGTKFVTAGKDGTVRIWDAKSAVSVCPVLTHSGPITCLAVSNDGHWLVTGSSDRTACVWDLASGTARFSAFGA